jgi:hypothetical protein
MVKQKTMNGNSACMGERKHSYKVLVGKPERSRGGHRPICKDNIKIDLMETAVKCMD